jgi:hypothetical protein
MFDLQNFFMAVLNIQELTVTGDPLANLKFKMALYEYSTTQKY